MNGKITVLLILLAGMAILLGTAGYLLPEHKKNTDRYYFQNSAGAVLFDHQFHTEQAEECAVCHHPLLLSSEKNECSMCHDPEMSPEYFEHADLIEIPGHSCVTCHAVSDSRSPQNCRSCHQKGNTSGQLIISCDNCHDDSYNPESFSHDDLVDIHEASCEGCHNARGTDEAYHQQCNRCHRKEAEDRFVVKNEIQCNMCHLK
ncbi:MAG: hypothetical protein JXL67_10225 [Calditrichaeota bacterium]|nr:hypothetical protein [Calditrichota bacterium]